jgi:hypothetical protein
VNLDCYVINAVCSLTVGGSRLWKVCYVRSGGNCWKRWLPTKSGLKLFVVPTEKEAIHVKLFAVGLISGDVFDGR